MISYKVLRPRFSTLFSRCAVSNRHGETLVVSHATSSSELVSCSCLTAMCCSCCLFALLRAFRFASLLFLFRLISCSLANFFATASSSPSLPSWLPASCSFFTSLSFVSSSSVGMGNSGCPTGIGCRVPSSGKGLIVGDGAGNLGTKFNFFFSNSPLGFLEPKASTTGFLHVWVLSSSLWDFLEPEASTTVSLHARVTSSFLKDFQELGPFTPGFSHV